MLFLTSKIREEKGKKVKNIRDQGKIPAVLYGPKAKNTLIEVEAKEFDKVYNEAGESSLVELLVNKDKFLVLIYALEIDPLSGKVIHIDFYQPKLDEEIEASIPLIFEGESLAVRDLGGTLVKNIHELDVSALPQDLPHEIKVNIESLKTFEDSILVGDLNIPGKVKVLKDKEETVAFVAEPGKVEEELEKPIEEKVEEVEKVEEKKEKEEAEE